MAQYIDKAALVAEINKRIIDAPVNNIGHQRVWAYNDVKDIIENLEEKEVDLEKEIKEEYLERRHYGGKFNMLVILNESQFNDIAKHFFELGLKAQKGEKV